MEFTLHQPVSHTNRKSIERVRFDTGGYNIRYYQKKAFQFADSTGYIVNTSLNVSRKRVGFTTVTFKMNKFEHVQGGMPVQKGAGTFIEGPRNKDLLGPPPLTDRMTERNVYKTENITFRNFNGRR